MANVIKLRKGLDINLKGKASQEFMSVKEPGFYALVPEDFTGITPVSYTHMTLPTNSLV